MMFEGGARGAEPAGAGAPGGDPARLPRVERHEPAAGVLDRAAGEARADLAAAE